MDIPLTIIRYIPIVLFCLALTQPNMSQFTIRGAITDEDTFFCQHVANRIQATGNNVSVDFVAVPEVEYMRMIEGMKQKHGGLFHTHTALHVVLRDGKYIGDLKLLIQTAVKDFNIVDASIASRAVFNRLVREETMKILNANREYVTMEFGDGANEKRAYGKITIELFTDLCPKACAHFISLCGGASKGSQSTSMSYLKCPIHRLIKDGWFQSGDVIDGSGANSVTIDSVQIPDECFSADFGFESGGIVGLANTGAHSNGSQFFVTLGPCEWMNNHYVGIGRLISGYKTLHAINQASATITQRPDPEIIIKSCMIDYNAK